jgi:hypothetical protein
LADGLRESILAPPPVEVLNRRATTDVQRRRDHHDNFLSRTFDLGITLTEERPHVLGRSLLAAGLEPEPFGGLEIAHATGTGGATFNGGR